MANKKRLIDANAFKIYLEEIRQEMLEENTMSCDFAAEVIETVQDEYLQNAPTVDAVEVVHGRWVEKGSFWNGDTEYIQTVECSHCNGLEDYATNYCPNCGAKMDGERKEK